MIFVLAFVSVGAPSYADEKGDLEKKLKEARQSVKDAKQEYREKKAEEQSLAEQIVDLEASIKKIESELRSVEGDIEENNDRIAVIEVDLSGLEADVGEQDSELMARLRVMYVTGDASVIEVLLDSASILDFLSNLDMIQRIHAQDVKTLEELQSKLNAVEQKKNELVVVKETLELHEQNAELKRERLSDEKDELAAAKAKAHAEAQGALEDIERMEKESKDLEKELKELESTATYGGGKMGWPVNGTITSEYGWRSHPSTGASHLHAGIDIAAPTGTPVHAAADGTVVKSSYFGGYGNAVIIDHGSGITTLYGHNSSLA
ncbi:MAG: peptidoglycan DD-metalloendopeptidase family protein, partial [Clostridiales Family XIII bacterium]|nr:peptidoglycan DD-metalloendopeptidase family protein [Clostridiales Family XIII bacterium]